MNRTLTVRTAEPTDLPSVAAINAHYVAHSVATFEETPRTLAQWHAALAEITERGLPFIVADDGTETLGYGYCTPWRARPAYRRTAENSVYVAPAATGRGVGAAILAALLDRCAAAEIKQVIAVIADSGDPASVALHRKHGFIEVGRLAAVGHKHGRWLDTVLMQRGLAPCDRPAGAS